MTDGKRAGIRSSSTFLTLLIGTKAKESQVACPRPQKTLMAAWVMFSCLL